LAETTPAANPATTRLAHLLAGSALPWAAVGILVVDGVFLVAGAIPDGAAAAVLAIVGGVLIGAYVLRPGLAPRASRPARVLSAVAAIGAALLTTLPALDAVAPGRPVARGALARKGDTLPLPSGVPSHVRLLVHVPFPQGGVPSIPFRITGTSPAAEGKLERTFTNQRVGRSGSARVAHDRSSAYVAARLPAGIEALTLERLGEGAAGPLDVSIYADRLPPLWHFLAAALVLAAAAFAEARLREGQGTAIAAIGIAFGILVADNATPEAAVGTSLGAVLLAALAGAAAGTLAAVVAKALVRGDAPRVQAVARAPGRRYG
jgi:hypothetical protein